MTCSLSACHFVTACVIQGTEGEKNPNQAADLGAETEGCVVGLFYFFPLLAD